MKQEEPIIIHSASTDCDGGEGGEGAKGHPKVYLRADENGEIVCPYCSRRYKMASNQASAASH